MADFSTTYAIDNTQEYNVICHLDGARRIIVQENVDSTAWASADLLMRGIAGSSQIKIGQGTQAEFAGGSFSFGQKVGTIQTRVGSITVLQRETTGI